MTPSSSPEKDQYRTKYQPVLMLCHQMLSMHLDGLLRGMFDNCPETLHELAENAGSSEKRLSYFQAKSQLLRQQAAIEREFLGVLKKGFAGFWEPQSVPEGAAVASLDGDLSLMTDESMEELVAVSNISRNATIDLKPQLYGLKQRLSVISGGRPIAYEAIPGGPDQIVQAFNIALNALNIAIALRRIILRLFDSYVMQHLEPMYDRYNSLLRDEGVLSFLAHEIHNLGAVKAGQRRDAVLDEGIEPDIPAQPAGQPALFDSIFDLMGKTTRSMAGGDADELLPLPAQAGQPQGPGGAASPQDFLAALNRKGFDRDMAGTQAGRIGDYFSLPDFRLREESLIRVDKILTEERHRLYQALYPRQIKMGDAAAIELLGKLFQYMLNEPLLPPLVKTLLGNLHIPYLKVAILDRGLLTNEQHPARRLFDLLVEGGIFWVNEQYLRHGIFPEMRQVAGRILNEFGEDLRLFDELLPLLSGRVDDLRRGSIAIERRTRNSAKGRERLELAIHKAVKKVSAVTNRPYLPQPLIDFLQQVWTDKLVFTLLSQSDEDRGEEWKAALNRMLELARLFNPEYLSEVTEQGLAELRDALQSDLGPLGDHLQKKSQALFDLLATPETVAAAISALPAKPLPVPESPEPSETPTKEQKAIEQIRNTPIGTWFLATVGDGRVIKGRLSWISPVTPTCIFVDGSGEECRTAPLQTLATEVLEGKTKIIEIDGRPFFTRALASIQQRLREESRFL